MCFHPVAHFLRLPCWYVGLVICSLRTVHFKHWFKRLTPSLSPPTRNTSFIFWKLFIINNIVLLQFLMFYFSGCWFEIVGWNKLYSHAVKVAKEKFLNMLSKNPHQKSHVVCVHPRWITVLCKRELGNMLIFRIFMQWSLGKDK